MIRLDVFYKIYAELQAKWQVWLGTQHDIPADRGNFTNEGAPESRGCRMSAKAERAHGSQ
jgi:hypothetical protein